MQFDTMRFETPEAGIGVLTLNRPERLNAINFAMLDDFYALFAELRERDDVRVLVLTGEGRGFCSGADLKDRRQIEKAAARAPDAATHLERVQKKYAGVILEMRRIPQPIIAAVNGHAAGGGMCLALASDVIVAGPGALFTPSFANIGLSGGELGTSYFLPRLVGAARAAEILLTGRTVDAVEADRIGLVSRLADGDRLMETAMETARSMLAKSRYGLRMTKELLTLNLNAPSLEAAVELENRTQSIGCYAADFFKAVEAFHAR